jgi:hypothetical protein
MIPRYRRWLLGTVSTLAVMVGSLATARAERMALLTVKIALTRRKKPHDRH